jgi:NDP-sugar pyrophosphorylase family protein
MMKVVIIAGGKGTRIQSITGEIPKPMMPINGKPVLEYQIELAKRQGFTDFLLLTGYLSLKIEEYFKSGKRWGVSIDYYKEKEEMGTAGAFTEIAHKLSSDFWVFYGDTIMNFDMQKMLNFHQKHKAQGTLFLHTSEHPEDSDLIEIDRDSRILNFYPKPNIGMDIPSLGNVALYILSPSLLRYIDKNKKSDWGKDVFPKVLAEGINLYGYISLEYVKDMGTPQRYQQVCNDLPLNKIS